MTEEHVDLNSRQEALESRVLLLCPSIGWWKGMYQLPRAGTDVVSNGRSVDRHDVTTPRAKLMTDDYPRDLSGTPWKKRLQKLDSRLSALKERYSVPFPINGVRIVPKSRGQAMLDEMYGLTIGRLQRRIQRANDEGQAGAANVMERHLAEAWRINGANAPANTPIYDWTKVGSEQSIAYDLHRATEEFCANWPTIRNEIATKNEVFALVESRVPHSAGLMRSKFHLDVVPVELASGISTTAVDQDALEAHNDIVREACHRRVEEAIESMIEGPRQQLAEALTDLKALITRDGNVTTKSFNPVRAAIAKIRMFDFVANATLLARMGELERQLDITAPNELDAATAANNGFTAAIDRFMDNVQDAQAQARDLEEFGRDFRSIAIDD